MNMFVEAVKAAFSGSVQIGPEFFQKSVNDYRDKFWAFCREILQNSLDCGSTWIDIRISEHPDDDGDGGSTIVYVANNGEPMSRETLVGKLLSLGSSGKDFQQGMVGGFGRAKEILYFAHESYCILSGSCHLEGSGAGYNLMEAKDPVLGTTSVVRWKGLVGDRLRKQFRRFIQLCGRRNCRFTLDGEDLAPSVPRFRSLKAMTHGGATWARLAYSDFEPNLLLVRIGGVPMFAESTNFKRSLVLELEGASGDRLTSNRDSLKHPYSSQLGDLLVQLAVDRRSALTVEEPVYKRYSGPKLGLEARAQAQAEDTPGTEVRVAARTDAPVAQGGVIVNVQGREEEPKNLLPYEFVIKNCVRRRIPREFDPWDLLFSNHAFWLAKAWSGCLLEMHRIFEVDHRFAIGFVISETTLAEFEKSPVYGRVYYLNPCIVTRKAITRRWKKDARTGIAATAAHEFVHGAFGEPYHDEDFAEKLTQVMGAMMRHWRAFARHLS
jgi:hypothetical protein